MISLGSVKQHKTQQSLDSATPLGITEIPKFGSISREAMRTFINSSNGKPSVSVTNGESRDKAAANARQDGRGQVRRR